MALIPLIIILVMIAGCSSGPQKPVLALPESQVTGPEIYSLNGSSNTVLPGDVIAFYIPKVTEGGTIEDHQTLLTIDQWPMPQIKTPSERPGLVLMGTASERVRVVGAHVYQQGPTLINPMAKLSNEEIRDLRGVCIEYWSDQMAERLQHINPDRTCVKLVGDACRPSALAALPKNLRYLVLESNRDTLLHGVSTFNNLAFLKISGNVSLSGIDACRQLAHLDLRFARNSTMVELGSLESLRVLNFENEDGLVSLGFVARLKGIRWLNISDTSVSDLTPLASLPELHAVMAEGTKITTLPEDGFSSLRRLSLLRTGITPEQAAGFMKRTPGCNLSWSYIQVLRDALQGADRIRVMSGGTCHEKGDRLLIEVTDAVEVQKVIGSIDVQEPRDIGRCGCCGRPSLEFYRGSQKLLRLGIHHGQLLRWPSSSWSADPYFTTASAEFICRWLADKGVPQPLQERSKK